MTRVRDLIAQFEKDRAGRCIVCGKKVRVLRNGRYGKHTVGQGRYTCHAVGQLAPRHERVRVRIMYRTHSKAVGFADDVVRWDGPGHRTVDLLYQGGTLGDYITRFDSRCRDLIAWDGLLCRYLFPPEPYPGAGEVPHGAWAAYVFYFEKTIVGNRLTSRRRQIEQELGSAAAHDFPLAS